MYLTEGHLWLFCFTYSFYCPFGYYQEVVNFHSQAWVTEVQSLRGGDTLQDGTLHACLLYTSDAADDYLEV